MKNNSFLPLFFILSGIVSFFVVQACQNQKKVETNPPQPDSTQYAVPLEADSSICGIANDDFGMNTFALTTDDGESIQVVRTRNDGSDGIIWGDIRPGDYFNMTTTDKGESLGTAINVTQLEEFVQNFSVWNARLILHLADTPDTVRILHLSADSLVTLGKEKKVFRPKNTPNTPDLH